MNETELDFLARRFSSQPPQAVLKWALKEYDAIAVSFSGAEDVVLVDMAAAIKPGVKVFSLDTGRLHAETYRFIERVRQHYDIDLELLYPDTARVQALVAEKGLFSFYQDGHSECCGVRKVEPLKRKLAELDAWITGQRRDQSPDTRAEVPVLQHDGAFSTADHDLVKINPLAAWNSSDVWRYIRERDVPYNKLHEQGFVSIGCEPCTKAVLPNQHEREGRWWWETADEKECGLHANNLESVSNQ